VGTLLGSVFLPFGAAAAFLAAGFFSSFSGSGSVSSRERRACILHLLAFGVLLFMFTGASSITFLLVSYARGNPSQSIQALGHPSKRPDIQTPAVPVACLNPQASALLPRHRGGDERNRALWSD